MKKLELPKKHLLIHGGVSDRHVYFIEKGFCRSYCLRDGEEITIWFSREGDITFAMKDLYHNQPGYEYVELLEDCELYAIRIDELNQIYETNIEIANWGRIICAMGYSGAQFDPEKVDLFFESRAGKIQIAENGVALDFSEEKATEILSQPEVAATADVKMGDAKATAWGCDLTHGYIEINADYRS